MDFLSWLFGKEEEEAPAEPLVLGALLQCEYGARPTFLYVEADDIDINALPQACVEDTKAHVNIQPFGLCMRNDDCTFKLDPDDRWVNAEPQNVRVNGKEIITTRSTLLCRATGMTIRPITSGQDGKFARFLLFLRDMDRRYPGLREVLEDPYGDLYLDGRYEAALHFLKDQVERRDGGLEINTLYDPEDLEGAYILAALERLLLDCDVRSFGEFMEDLSTTAFERDMEGAEGWDKNYLNETMLELLRIDCQATARRIETDPVYRRRVQNKKFSSWLRESTSAVAYTAVLYASMLAASNVPGKGVKDTVDEETKEAVDQGEGSNSIDVDNIFKSASQPKKGGETIAGHALQKHAGRNPDIWGKVHGNSDSINNAAMKHIEEILDAPGSFQTVESNGCMFLEKMLPDGRGIRLNMDGTFKGFIDQIR